MNSEFLNLGQYIVNWRRCVSLSFLISRLMLRKPFVTLLKSRSTHRLLTQSQLLANLFCEQHEVMLTLLLTPPYTSADRQSKYRYCDSRTMHLVAVERDKHASLVYQCQTYGSFRKSLQRQASAFF